MKTTWPTPFNPSGAPQTPGYRFLGLGELVGPHDETLGSNGVWSVSCCRGQIITGYWRLTCRRALCVDDLSAPPPEQWSIPGWQVLTDGHVNMNDEFWSRPTDTWSSNLGGYLGPVTATPLYYRRKVGAESAPTKRLVLALNQSIVVSVGSSAILSRAVQEAAFAAGWAWSYAQGDPLRTQYAPFANDLSNLRIRFKPNRTLGWRFKDKVWDDEVADTLYLDARTDMGQLIDLLASVPPQPAPPTINGYAAEYIKDSPVIKFGCANLSVEMLDRVARAMGMKRIQGEIETLASGGNRTISSVTLDSGVKLSCADVRTALSYVDQVNKG